MIDKKTEEAIMAKVDEIVSKANADIDAEVTNLRGQKRADQRVAYLEANPMDLSNLFNTPRACIKIADLACSAIMALEAVVNEIPKPAGDTRKNIIYMRLINKITNQQAALLQHISQTARILSVQTDNIRLRLNS